MQHFSRISNFFRIFIENSVAKIELFSAITRAVINVVFNQKIVENLQKKKKKKKKILKHEQKLHKRLNQITSS